VSFATITLCVASQQVFIIVVVCFVIASVQKLLDAPLKSPEEYLAKRITVEVLTTFDIFMFP
jgi:hypothetical protein